MTIRVKLIFISFSLCAMMLFGLARADTQNYPRFETLKPSKANLRKGPGVEFPIDWTYQGGGIPFQILSEYNGWYRVQDLEGSKGWILKRFFSSKRTVQISSTENVPVHTKAAESSKVTAWASHLTKGNIVKCEAEQNWCLIEFDTHKGFVLKKHLWGVFEHETIQQ